MNLLTWSDDPGLTNLLQITLPKDEKLQRGGDNQLGTEVEAGKGSLWRDHKPDEALGQGLREECGGGGQTGWDSYHVHGGEAAHDGSAER